MEIFRSSGLIVVTAVLLAMAPSVTESGDTGIKHNHNSDIAEIAAQTDALSTLLTAVEAAGLEEILKSEGPFTLFAPTNEAFDALPYGTLESLLMEENRDQLIDILTYHVIPGKVMSADLSDGMTAGTVQGSEVTITVNNNGVSVDGASVVHTDVEASNGVVHIIDAVIIPQPETESAY
jgi:uncharacterized surface protein with fasciclin (FAS1) repeats